MKEEIIRDKISQYHNIVRDMSNHSFNMKKFCFTLYITLLSIYLSKSTSMSECIFLIIGLLIPIFSYFFEIYIDINRQKMRLQLERCNNELSGDEKEIFLVLRIFFIDFELKKSNKINKNKLKNKNNKILRINLTHWMYLFYLALIILTLCIGFLIK